MGFEPWTLGLQGQGIATELQWIIDKCDGFLNINVMKIGGKLGKPAEKSLLQLSIRVTWANL